MLATAATAALGCRENRRVTTPIAVDVSQSPKPAAVVDERPAPSSFCVNPDIEKETLFCRVERADDHELAKIAERKEVTSLELLALRSRSLEALAHMTWLESLKVGRCEKGFTALAPIDAMTRLRNLEVSSCEGLTSLSLPDKSALQSLTLYETQVSRLDGLRGASLQRVAIRNTPLTDLAPLMVHRQSLVQLYLSGIPNLRDDSGVIPELRQLQHLVLNNLGLTSLDVTRLTKLTTLLALSECKKLRDLRGLSSLTELRQVSLNDMPLLTDLSTIGIPPKVETLLLRGTKAQDLMPLAQWKSLKFVVVPNDTPETLIAALTSSRPDINVRRDSELRTSSP
jgi:Leucine-rich repeat (LRR) protein